MPQGDGPCTDSAIWAQVAQEGRGREREGGVVDEWMDASEINGYGVVNGSNHFNGSHANGYIYEYV